MDSDKVIQLVALAVLATVAVAFVGGLLVHALYPVAKAGWDLWVS